MYIDSVVFQPEVKSMTNENAMEEVLKELRNIRKLMVSSLIVSGVEATTVAEVLGYKGVSSISNEIPVAKLKKESKR
jgi:hypothetical protein